MVDIVLIDNFIVAEKASDLPWEARTSVDL